MRPVEIVAAHSPEIVQLLSPQALYMNEWITAYMFKLSSGESPFHFNGHAEFESKGI